MTARANCDPKTDAGLFDGPGAQPFFCADCGAELRGKGRRMRDGRTVCGACARRAGAQAAAKAQHSLFGGEQGAPQTSSLFDSLKANPARISVTPALARELLKLNVGNKPVDKKRIKAIAARMRAGRYQDRKGLTFTNGILTDGQHRLFAVVESGATVPFKITRKTLRPRARKATPDKATRRPVGSRAASKANPPRLWHVGLWERIGDQWAGQVLPYQACSKADALAQARAEVKRGGGKLTRLRFVASQDRAKAYPPPVKRKAKGNPAECDSFSPVRVKPYCVKEHCRTAPIESDKARKRREKKRAEKRRAAERTKKQQQRAAERERRRKLSPAERLEEKERRRAQRPQATRARRRRKPDEELSLSQFVRRAGGFKPDEMFAGELRRLGRRESGTTGLVRRKGKAPDRMLESANESGFRDADGQPFSRIGEFIEAVEMDHRGVKKLYHPGREAWNPGQLFTDEDKRKAKRVDRRSFFIGRRVTDRETGKEGTIKQVYFDKDLSKIYFEVALKGRKGLIAREGGEVVLHAANPMPAIGPSIMGGLAAGVSSVFSDYISWRQRDEATKSGQKANPDYARDFIDELPTREQRDYAKAYAEHASAGRPKPQPHAYNLTPHAAQLIREGVDHARLGLRLQVHPALLRANGKSAGVPPAERRKLDRLARMFQGAASGDVRTLAISRHDDGKNLDRAGNLEFIRLKNRPASCDREAKRLDYFSPERVRYHLCRRCGVRFNPARSMLAYDARRLYPVGAGVRFKKPQLDDPEGFANHGPVDLIGYYTAKRHIGAGHPFIYVHPFAEQTRRVSDMPELHIDSDGMPRLVGGAYRITRDGIIN